MALFSGGKSGWVHPRAHVNHGWVPFSPGKFLSLYGRDSSMAVGHEEVLSLVWCPAKLWLYTYCCRYPCLCLLVKTFFFMRFLDCSISGPPTINIFILILWGDWTRAKCEGPTDRNFGRCCVWLRYLCRCTIDLAHKLPTSTYEI